MKKQIYLALLALSFCIATQVEASSCMGGRCAKKEQVKKECKRGSCRKSSCSGCSRS